VLRPITLAGQFGSSSGLDLAVAQTFLPAWLVLNFQKSLAKWSGVFVPISTPSAIVAKLQMALAKTIRDPGVETKLKALAVNRGVVTPEEFKHVIESEIIKYKGVIKAADLHFT